jgi:hypothetical protein
MQLQRKADNKPVQKAEVKPFRKVLYNMNTHRECMENICSFGKYINKTWRYVCAEDPGYSEWVRKEQLLGSLGVLVLRNQPSAREGTQESQERYITADGTVWLGLREITCTNNEKCQWIDWL